MVTATRAETRLIEIAKEARLPKDSLHRFLSAYYVPQPKQLLFHAACRSADRADGPDQIGYGGARGGAKSHSVFAQVALDDCQRFPNLKVLYLRKVSRNAREQFEDLRRVVLAHTPHEYKRQAGMVLFPNNSRVLIGHFRTEADVDQYLGLEYDLIVIEEATTLTLNKYKTLRDSNRTSKPGWRPRIYCTTNPGNVGHVWFKGRFITPHREGHSFAPFDLQRGDTRFIPATVDDNCFIDAGYKKKLEENTGWKLRAYRYGDWDIAAGQYFSTWRHDLHVIKPFKVPRHWPVWMALDYGWNHPTVAYLLTENDGMIYVIAEHWERKRLPPWHSERIKEMLSEHDRIIEELDDFVAGADVFAHKGDSEARTIADQYASHGIVLSCADTDRVNGAGEVLQLLGDPESKQEPKIQVFDTCTHLIECIPALEHNPNKPEDVLKADVDEEGNGGDDPYDALRYAVMARRKYYSGAPLTGGRRVTAQ
jgi:phage terminase large subunit